MMFWRKISCTFPLFQRKTFVCFQWRFEHKNHCRCKKCPLMFRVRARIRANSPVVADKHFLLARGHFDPSSLGETLPTESRLARTVPPPPPANMKTFQFDFYHAGFMEGFIKGPGSTRFVFVFLPQFPRTHGHVLKDASTAGPRCQTAQAASISHSGETRRPRSLRQQCGLRSGYV